MDRSRISNAYLMKIPETYRPIDEINLVLNRLFLVYLANGEFSLARVILEDDLVLRPAGVMEFNFGDVEFTAPIIAFKEFES